MKAMILSDFGGVDKFALKNIDAPVISDDEVLIQVVAVDINPIDIKTRQGEGMASRYEKGRPIVLGWDVSGVVVAAGKDVNSVKVGDEVFGMINFPGTGGAYAEYVAAPANQVARKPVDVPHIKAAAATLSALTAWQAIVDHCNIKECDRVLIHGGAGGVGNFAVQIAKFFKAYVVATASAEDSDFVKESGADEVIDYKNQKFEDIEQPFDYILDTIGGENFVRSLKVLKPDGLIVILPSNKVDEAEKTAQEQHIKNFRHILVHPNNGGMEKIATLLNDCCLQVNIEKVFDFEDLPKAHELLENGKVRGKVVVTVS